MTSHAYIFGGALPPFLESWGALAPPSAATGTGSIERSTLSLNIYIYYVLLTKDNIAHCTHYGK